MNVTWKSYRNLKKFPISPIAKSITAIFEKFHTPVLYEGGLSYAYLCDLFFNIYFYITSNHKISSKVALEKRLPLLKKRLCHRCFPANFAKFLRTPFLQNTSGRLLFKVVFYWISILTSFLKYVVSLKSQLSVREFAFACGFKAVSIWKFITDDGSMVVMSWTICIIITRPLYPDRWCWVFLKFTWPFWATVQRCLSNRNVVKISQFHLDKSFWKAFI